MTKPKYREVIARECKAEGLCRVPACPLCVEQLQEMSPFISNMRKGADGNCWGCGDLIEVGDTCWNPTNKVCSQVPHRPLDLVDDVALCYRCGVSWEMHEGRLLYSEARSLSPYANSHLGSVDDR